MKLAYPVGPCGVGVLSAGRGRDILGGWPGVAELADALDSKTNAARFLIVTHRCSSKYKGYLAVSDKKGIGLLTAAHFFSRRSYR